MGRAEPREVTTGFKARDPVLEPEATYPGRELLQHLRLRW